MATRTVFAGSQGGHVSAKCDLCKRPIATGDLYTIHTGRASKGRIPNTYVVVWHTACLRSTIDGDDNPKKMLDTTRNFEKIRKTFKTGEPWE